MYLNCKTWFSLRYGTFSTEQLVEAAGAHGAVSLALTNINSTSDAWDFVSFCHSANIKPVLGAEIRNDDNFCYILLAKNNNGFFHINRFISGHLEPKLPFPTRPLLSADVLVIYSLGSIQPDELSENELIGVQITEVNKLFSLRTINYPGKFVVRHPVTFQDQDRYNTHKLLRCIDKNILHTKLDASQIAAKHEIFLPATKIMQAFQSYPGIITNTLQVIDQCSISLDFNTDKTKKIFSASKEDDRKFLEKLALDGLVRRYGSKNKIAKERVLKELKIINDLGFNAYFLVTWDILREAQSQGFFYVGRGSGANSIVAYCLTITDVDPIDLDLYFERFLNPYRASPPDFDLDFSWADRDQVTDYIFKRFGSEHVALLGSYVTFQDRAVLRELGKVFGLPKDEIDGLGHPSTNFKEDKVKASIFKYAAIIKDFPNHLSVHAGGILISELPIHQYTATELPPKGFITTQIDMFVAEKIALYKLDILSQRGLGHIKDTVGLVAQNKGVLINIRNVEKFKKDPLVATMIRTANTTGCFYIESPAMRQLLAKLLCDDYLSLVIASSVIRPGVASSGMMRQYIHYFHHPDQVKYLHPKLKELLPDTFGIMIFQEDVIKVVHFLGRLDLAKADVVRKGMSGKYRGGMHFDELRDEFYKNCYEDGIDEATYKEIWRLIDSFKGYSFSKAHSASYAVESYQSAYLKAYFPKEFMVAVINNFGGFYSRELYFHELRKTGAEILPPCVNEGEYLTSIRDNIVYVGFIHISGLQKQIPENIIEERKKYGKYLHLQDFIERTNIPLEQLNLLVRINALRFTGKNKKELLWEANFLQKNNEKHVPAHTSLFIEPPIEFKLPQLEQTSLENAYDEIDLLGFPLGNMWDLVDIELDEYQPANNLPAHLGKAFTTIGYYVTEKPVHTVKKETMYYGTFLDKEGQWLDTVHFPNTFKFSPFQGRGFYILKGKVVEEFNVYSLQVFECKKIGIKQIG